MFRLLGFDVHVRMGFVVFLGLIVLIYQGDHLEFGVWLAAGIAGFTLVHELGHAVAARSAGAKAAISLDFLAGYTSFAPEPGQTISRSERALITAAGPLVHIVVSVAVLGAMGVNPLSLDSIRQSDAAAALWWAGPVIGALNLVPVLPLDGGHLALTAVEGWLGERALRVTVIASLVITGGITAAMFATGRGGFGIFVAFLLINQVQLLQATGRDRGSGPVNRLADAEASAWQSGRPGVLEPGQRVSPWFEAHRALATGDTEAARQAIVSDLVAERPPRWAPPTAASPHHLAAIVEALPEPLPHGNQYSERILADVMLATGHHSRAGRYAVDGYNRHRTSTLATVVARASAAMGDLPNAIRWLEAAADDAADEGGHLVHLLAVVMDRAPEFSGLRASPEFASLRSNLA